MKYYKGPETIEAYHAWLDKEYPFWRQAPLYTVLSDGRMVVGYCELDGKPGVNIAPPDLSYEKMIEVAESVHLSCILPLLPPQ